MQNWINNIIANKHTSGAALAGFALGAVAIIWPQYANKCSQLQMLATAYGFAMASDANKAKPPLTPTD